MSDFLLFKHECFIFIIIVLLLLCIVVIAVVVVLPLRKPLIKLVYLLIIVKDLVNFNKSDISKVQNENKIYCRYRE